MAERNGTIIDDEVLEPSLKVAEFYAGIGGFHYALRAAGLSTRKINAKIVASIDINTNTSSIYAHNFPKTLQLNRNICGMTASDLDRLEANVFFLSPPCQPFTRQGNCRDDEDRRTDSFFHLMDSLKNMHTPPGYLLMENVKGFEESKTRDEFLSVLNSLGYVVQEFLLNPNQFGIPNSRLRYYLLAKKKPMQFAISFHKDEHRRLIMDAELLMQIVMSSKGMRSLHTSETSLKPKRCSSQTAQLGVESKPEGDSKGTEYQNIEETCLKSCKTLSHYCETLSDDSLANFLVPDKILCKYAIALDIVRSSSLHSCCFTKGYSNYAVGTGSILQHSLQEEEFTSCFKEFKDSDGNVECLRILSLRYFTPREVSNLMCFPPDFIFPSHLSIKQCYKALGNSLNVTVVSFLIRYLFLY